MENDVGHGSARSIEKFNLHDALESCKELFEKFGGHAAACGFTIKRENIEPLRIKLNEHAAAILTDEDLIPELQIDASVSSQSLNLELVADLKKLEPYGAGNPKPKFATKDLIIVEEPYVMKEKHLKLKLADDGGRKFEAVWWDGVDKSKERTLKPKTRIELAYTPEANTWNGTTRLQLVVEDLKLIG